MTAQQTDTNLSSAIVALVQGASLELMPRDKAAVDRCIEKAVPGSEIYIARVPGDAHGATVEILACPHAPYCLRLVWNARRR